MEQQAVAVLGAGALGAAIADRLVDTGHQVKLWDRTAERAQEVAAASAGMTAVDDVTDAVRDVAMVLTLLRDGAAVTEVMDTAIGAIDADAVWVRRARSDPRLHGHSAS